MQQAQLLLGWVFMKVSLANRTVTCCTCSHGSLHAARVRRHSCCISCLVACTPHSGTSDLPANNVFYPDQAKSCDGLAGAGRSSAGQVPRSSSTRSRQWHPPKPPRPQCGPGWMSPSTKSMLVQSCCCAAQPAPALKRCGRGQCHKARRCTAAAGCSPQAKLSRLQHCSCSACLSR